MKKLVLLSAAISVLALIAGYLMCIAGGPLARPIGGDAPYYAGLARSLAAGNGYVLDRTPWPHSASLRPPLWPVILTPFVYLFPGAGEYAIVRCTTVLLHAIAAVLLMLLTFRLWGDYLGALLAGALFTLYPVALSLVGGGFSEHSFIVVATAGFLLMFDRGPKQMLGALLLGLGVLARSNFVILPFVFAFVAIVWRPAYLRHWKRMAVLSLAFLLPASVWILRNYLVSGVLPVLNPLEGETLYGGNNSIVANDLSEWGYWVFPDRIPLEIPKQQLAKRMNEAELNRYYMEKALTYMRQHWFAYPRLILGKLIRGFVPVPWLPRFDSYMASLLRWCLYGAFLWAACSHILRNECYALLLVAVLIVTLITTMLCYGTYRFTFCIEVYLIPCVGVFLVERWRRWRRVPEDSLAATFINRSDRSMVTTQVVER
jgi:hypothetical protein